MKQVRKTSANMSPGVLAEFFPHLQLTFLLQYQDTKTNPSTFKKISVDMINIQNDLL